MDNRQRQRQRGTGTQGSGVMRKQESTRRQSDALRDQNKKAGVIRQWFDDRRDAAAKRHIERPERPGGHGITRVLRNMPMPVPEFVVRHDYESGWARRHTRTSEGAVVNLTSVKRRSALPSRPSRRDRRIDQRKPALNKPYTTWGEGS